MPNRTAPAASANTSIGNAVRYKLMPQARITISSLFFVNRPTVTSDESNTESAMMYDSYSGVDQKRNSPISPMVACPLKSLSDMSMKAEM